MEATEKSTVKCTRTEQRQSLALLEAASSSNDTNTNALIAPKQNISWYDSSDGDDGDDDSTDEEVWLDFTTIQERLSMLSSSSTCDMLLTDKSRTDLQASEQEQESSSSMVTFAMESTRVINYDPPAAEYHDKLFYKEWELQRFRDIYNLLQSLPKMKK